jgi:hypothetical protein
MAEQNVGFRFSLGEAKMEGKGAWEVARYEIDMHETLSDRPSSLAMRNAVTESVVLHARQLCEMFLSLSNKDDNVKLADLISDREQSEQLRELIAELRGIYGDGRKKESPRWVFNKMLLHPTKIRTDGYDYGSALNSVRPVLKKLSLKSSPKGGRLNEG